MMKPLLASSAAVLTTPFHHRPPTTAAACPPHCPMAPQGCHPGAAVGYAVPASESVPYLLLGDALTALVSADALPPADAADF